MMTNVLNEILTANRDYVTNFDKGHLPMSPSRHFAILTCMDARLDPAKYAGLREGDAHVIRNAGGRASDDAIRSLIISYKLLGTREWFVIHHTDCGMQTLTYEITRTLLASRLKAASVEARGGHDCCKNSESTEAKMTDWLIIKDQVQSILEDVRRIKSHPWVPWNISVYALVYDVKSGKLIEVPEATAIGK